MKLSLLMVMVLTPAFVCAQDDATAYFQGFAGEISGKSYTYHSPFPDVTSSLIMRGRADFTPIRWRTEVVPESYRGDTVTFIWIYSMDTDPEPVPFSLSVNGIEWFRFSSPLKSQIGTWSVEGNQGAKLSFRVTMLDRFEDEMGFAILKLPIGAIEPGRGAVLEIAAEAVEDDSWFMTYKAGISEQINIYQNKVVVRDQDQLLHSLSVDMIHLGDDVFLRGFRYPAGFAFTAGSECSQPPAGERHALHGRQGHCPTPERSGRRSCHPGYPEATGGHRSHFRGGSQCT